ncbi:MAG: hypothetical protein H6621_04425 [Halobacteriovoraceae bacterium]|nr:hypothetical protein [Halobacteriovoraceae bacterium]
MEIRDILSIYLKRIKIFTFIFFLCFIIIFAGFHYLRKPSFVYQKMYGISSIVDPETIATKIQHSFLNQHQENFAYKMLKDFSLKDLSTLGLFLSENILFKPEAVPGSSLLKLYFKIKSKDVNQFKKLLANLEENILKPKIKNIYSWDYYSQELKHVKSKLELQNNQIEINREKIFNLKNKISYLNSWDGSDINKNKNLVTQAIVNELVKAKAEVQILAEDEKRMTTRIEELNAEILRINNVLQEDFPEDQNIPSNVEVLFERTQEFNNYSFLKKIIISLFFSFLMASLSIFLTEKKVE